MKSKFFLMLLALTGLCWSANSVSATVTPMLTERQNANLSQTMAQLIGFDRDTYSLLEMAIDRALIAQQVNEVPPPPQMRTAGVPVAKPPEEQPSEKKPPLDGKWDAQTRPIGQIKKKKSTPDRSQPAGGIKVKKQ